MSKKSKARKAKKKMKMKFFVQDGEGGAGEIRVCSMVRYFPNDLEGECSQCQAPIFYRPEPPFLSKFLCMKCAAPIMTNDNSVEIRMSKEAARTAEALFGKLEQ